MKNIDGLSVIHKKARVAREDFDARAMSPAKALRLAFAQAAEDHLDMALTVTTLEQTRVSTAALTEGLADDALLILLDGAGGARGVAILDTQVVAALIEMQVTGAVRAGEARPRAYTRTDAAMMAPLLDAGLDGADALLAEHQEGYECGHFRFGDKVEDARVLSLALQGLEFDLFHMTVAVENGAKSGALSLALPVREKRPATASASQKGASPPTASLRKLALDAPVTLNAVLARIRRPLNEICRFQPGMLLAVAPEALDQAELVARPRHLVAEGRLGQVGGMRAIRIHLPGEEHDQPGAGPAQPAALAATGALDRPESDLSHLSLSADEPDPDLHMPLPPMGFAGADDSAVAELSSRPDSEDAEMDFSRRDNGPDDALEPDDSADPPMPEPLPMLDLP